MASETPNARTVRAAEFAERAATDPAWDALAAEDPDLAYEAALAAAVRQVMAALGTQRVALPPDFEARLMARLRADKTLLDLLNVSFSGFSRVLLDLLNILIGFIPGPAVAPTPA